MTRIGRIAMTRFGSREKVFASPEVSRFTSGDARSPLLASPEVKRETSGEAREPLEKVLPRLRGWAIGTIARVVPFLNSNVIKRIRAPWPTRT